VDGKRVLMFGGHYIHHYLVEPGYKKKILKQKFKEKIFNLYNPQSH
jgi:hypothetical protein